MAAAHAFSDQEIFLSKYVVIQESERAFSERKKRAKPIIRNIIRNITRRILPLAAVLLLVEAIVLWVFGYLNGETRAYFGASFLLVPLLLICLFRFSSDVRVSWKATDKVIWMPGGFFVPWGAIIQWEAQEVAGVPREKHIVIVSKGNIRRSLTVDADDNFRDFYDMLLRKCPGKEKQGTDQ